MAIVFGLVSALMFGLLDICIAHTTRMIGMMYTLVLAHALAAAILVLYLFAHTSSITAGIQPDTFPLLLCIGGALGIVSCLTNLSLYKGLEMGPLAIISPVAASYGLITVFLTGIVLHEFPSPMGSLVFLLIIGGMILMTNTRKRTRVPLPRFSFSRSLLPFFGLTMILSCITVTIVFALLHWLEINIWLALVCCIVESIGIVLACCLAHAPTMAFSQWWTNHGLQSGILFGIGAMIGFGVEYFLLSLASTHLGPIHPVALSRLCSALFLFTYTRNQRMRGWGEIKLKHVGFIILIGLLDILGTIFYDVGSGQSTVLVAALSSTYPILPFLFGVIRYHEKVSIRQWSGVGIMILGMIGLTFLGK